MSIEEFKDLSPKPQTGLYSSEQVASGIPIPKTKRIELFSSDEWEEFTEEWATSLETSFHKVKRFAGAGDKGLDVVGFISDSTFEGGWINYQCKHYDKPLTPSEIWVEFGKIIYYSFLEDYTPPNKFYFVAPKQVGTTLALLLSNTIKLKSELKTNWPKYCQDKITKTSSIVLEGDILEFFENFDFSIFDFTTLVEMISGHMNTTFHAVRFGGGLASRPIPEIPAENTISIKPRYVQQLLAVYAENFGDMSISCSLDVLDKSSKYKKGFLRQRERFYHAESLRNFSRDTVPEGTFELLQEDIYQGVVDINEGMHVSGLERMNSTVTQAAIVAIDSSPLLTVTRPADKQGICHQLINDERLNWIDDDE